MRSSDITRAIPKLQARLKASRIPLSKKRRAKMDSQTVPRDNTIARDVDTLTRSLAFLRLSEAVATCQTSEGSGNSFFCFILCSSANSITSTSEFAFHRRVSWRYSQCKAPSNKFCCKRCIEINSFVATLVRRTTE